MQLQPRVINGMYGIMTEKILVKLLVCFLIIQTEFRGYFVNTQHNMLYLIQHIFIIIWGNLTYILM